MPPELRRKEKDFVFCVDYTRYKILKPIKPNYWLNSGGQDSNLRRRFMRPCWILSSLPRIILLEIHDSLVAIDAATRLAFSSHLRIGDFILAFPPIEKTVF